MAVLKYKNGSTWTALDLAMKSDLGNYATKDDLKSINTGAPSLSAYPVGSVYIGAATLFRKSTTPSDPASYVTTTEIFSNPVSPASFLGGTWISVMGADSNSSFSRPGGSIIQAGYYYDSSLKRVYTYGITHYATSAASQMVYDSLGIQLFYRTA